MLIKLTILTLALTAWWAPPALASDSSYLQLAAEHTPVLAIERGGDTELPVDFRVCRAVACSQNSRHPVLFLHAVPRPGFLYLEYWEYLPDSRFAHTGIPLIDGYHRDDWEGAIVKLRSTGAVVGARATAHLGFNGRHPWWDLAANDWARYPAVIYRAAGSHGGSFQPRDVDLAGDAWNGTARTVRPALVAADVASRTHAVFSSGAVAPWAKQAWRSPETTITGHPGDTARYATYARLWALLCGCE